ncbi:ATP-dependent Clp protease adaptor protein ClpS [Tenacibaculum lutimaris]|uniref:ATP-dependent Clp protease adaptor protein ClpS n=2 Tax=Flavobacteriaceae TaxID=49546 RepID=A0A420E392_9FLAO|nr:ATP-dependent Clp protease adaptor protein ClpS [Tenacibaculum lutimaris]
MGSFAVSKIKPMSTIEKIQEELDVLLQGTTEHEIVLYNDDVNTFDFVIDSLVTVCDHTLEQAEQCTILVHYKGKCAVKTGEYKDLEPRCSKLLELGLSAEIV